MKSTLCIEKQIFLDNPRMYLEIAEERPISIVEGSRLLRLEEVVPSSTAVSEHDKTICAEVVLVHLVHDILWRKQDGLPKDKRAAVGQSVHHGTAELLYC